LDDRTVAVLGFYGDRLKVGFGSLGGWDPFGPERLITRSQGNILYELDGKSVLELYKLYLGDHAKGLLTGFYSYGEISPFTPGADCALHNQTMSITTLLKT
jgi:hypothetical protein